MQYLGEFGSVSAVMSEDALKDREIAKTGHGVDAATEVGADAKVGGWEPATCRGWHLRAPDGAASMPPASGCPGAPGGLPAAAVPGVL